MDVLATAGKPDHLRLTSDKPTTSSEVTTWKGRALLVVRSGKDKGKTQITVKSPLGPAKICIK